jgi:dephospho-CoA kinase
MRRVLVTGMSGTGKSSALAELRRRGFETVDTAGTVSNQGRFYRSFDAVVLLSATRDVLLGRIEDRTTNDYGKTEDQRALILEHLADVEPLLRATCTHEIDASRPLDEVVAELLHAVREP